LRHLLTGWRGKSPWHGRFYSRVRLKDWLSVLDYRILHSSASFIRPPINSERLLYRLRQVEKLQPWMSAVGGVYIMQARKQTIPLTMQRKQWRQRAGMPAGSIARSAEQAKTVDTLNPGKPSQ